MYQSNIGIKGRYRIDRVYYPGTSIEYKVEVVPWFDNVITDNGLNWICNDVLFADRFNNRCVVGSGNTTPTTSDVNLVSYLGYGDQYSFTQGNYGSPNYVHYGRWVYRFNAGNGTGNISEVGLANSSNQVSSRALILDGLGNPTTITKLSDEILDVTYELQFNYNVSGATGSFTLTGDKGGSYNYTVKPCQASNNFATNSLNFFGLGATGITTLAGYSGSITGVTGAPSGSGVSLGTMEPQTYTTGTFYRDYVSSNGIGVGNVSGGLLTLYNNGERKIGYHQWELNTAIPKTSSDSLTLNFRITLSRV